LKKVLVMPAPVVFECSKRSLTGVLVLLSLTGCFTTVFHPVSDPL
jgi:hypothetical protein